MHIELWKGETDAASGKLVVETFVIVIEHTPIIFSESPGTHMQIDT